MVIPHARGQSGSMSGIVLIALAVMAGQDAPRAPSPVPPSTYEAPPVRPFEPGADFDPPAAQGAEGIAGRRTPAAAVIVEAYRGDYEHSPTDLELAYDQGVSQAEISMDARMGALDGRWRVVEADGRPLYDLILSDAGSGPVEGAWKEADGRDGGVVASVDRETGAPVTLVLDGRCLLRLTRTRAGVEAVLIRDGRERPVTLLKR